MVIPIGPPMAQHVLRIVKVPTWHGVRTVQTDVFGGRAIRFLPMRRLEAFVRA
jgi:protein-L-isoaspartate(D-aspartate) O-methyltransferase